MLKGRKVSFVPGWDCHGLPIELKVCINKEQFDENVVQILVRILHYFTNPFGTIKLSMV